MDNWKKLYYFIPLIMICAFLFTKSLKFPLHDYSNSYFPALLSVENTPPENILFNIYDFNQYAWDSGYPEVLIDFYLNSPFTPTAFYLLALIDDAYLSKAIFNALSLILFLIAVHALTIKYPQKNQYLLVLLPLLFYTPLRNHTLYGQSYLISFFLIVIAFKAIENKRLMIGSPMLVLAALIKIFPLFYGVSLIANKQWKAVGIAVIASAAFLSLSFYASGISLWQTYLLEVFPNAIANESTVDFYAGSQSMEVFLKTLFIRDTYYNPMAIVDSYRSYKVLSWIFKALVIGVAINLSVLFKKDLFQLLSIWVVTLFVVQTRTASYAQILWLIPLFSIIHSNTSMLRKLGFVLLLLLVCNFPFGKLIDTPVFFRFLRLWLSMGLAYIYFRSLPVKVNPMFIGAAFIFLTPFHLKVFEPQRSDSSVYVLDEKKDFMIYDFQESDGFLSYQSLGKGGQKNNLTELKINGFDSLSCSIKNGQVYYLNIQLTANNALKKKPILVNEHEVIYLSDHHSRRGAFTLKSIDISEIKNN